MTRIARLASCCLITLLALLPPTPALAQEAQARATVADNSAEVAETPAGPVAAEDAAEAAESPARPVVAAATADQPKTMSGMSILGNEEAPKALVIVPWKSSELGDELGMSENLDDRALPVDKEVFMRKLQFYEIRKED